MRFSYRYRNSDNVQQSGVVAASSRDEAFRTLRARGIRAYDVSLAPGLANRLAALGKRGWAIIVLCAVCVTLCAVALRYSHKARNTADEVRILVQGTTRDARVATTLPRHQIAALPSDWLALLPRYLPESTDQFFARYAVPGVLVESPTAVESSVVATVFPPDWDKPLVPTPEEPAWIADIKLVVNGMKEEAQALMQTGKTPAEISTWLDERQKMEASYRAQILSGPGTDAEKLSRLKAMNL